MTIKSDKDYETQLENHFSLRVVSKGWHFDGNASQDYVEQLGDSETCFRFLKIIRTKQPFDQVCVVVSKPVLIVCNSAPPVGFFTGLNATEIADLIVTIVEAGGKQVYDYQGALLLRLP